MKISKNEIKYIRQLHQKKYRDERGVFMAQGEKLVKECIQFQKGLEYLVAGEEWIKEQGRYFVNNNKLLVKEASFLEMQQITTLTTPPEVLLVMKKLLPPQDLNPEKGKWSLLLDGIKDPGNMGTILRLADWFGITSVFCTLGTVELYNPKVIQASMGAFLRVNVSYIENDWLENMKRLGFDLAGADLEGKNIYEEDFRGGGILVLGNEAHGLSMGLEALLNKKITIPSFGKRKTSESLNVAMATAVICGEISRQMMNYSK